MVFVTPRDFDFRTNIKTSFSFKEDKDGPTTLFEHMLKKKNINGGDILVCRIYLFVSERKFELKFWDRAEEQGIVTVDRRNSWI